MKSSKKKRTRGRGFTRTNKQWEETITRHMGKIIDNVSISSLLPYVIVAYYGFQATQSHHGAAVGIIGLKLATAGNITAGVTGLAILGMIGLTQVTKGYDPLAIELQEISPDTAKMIQDFMKEKGLL